MNVEAYTPEVRFYKSRHGKVAIIRISGRFRAMELKNFDRLLQDFLDEDGERLLLDISDLRVIQSPVIGAILEISQMFARLGKQIGLVNPTDHVRYTLHITRLTEIVPIYDSLEDALHAVDALPSD